MPEKLWEVDWKRNRNHRGKEILPEGKAFALAEEKRGQGFKVNMKKLPGRKGIPQQLKLRQRMQM